MAEYRLTPAARSDIRSIWAYTDDEWGSAQADRYLGQIEETLELLVRNPTLGRPRDEVRAGFRSHSAGRHMIFYRMAGGDIEIARILHQRMNARLHINPAAAD